MSNNKEIICKLIKAKNQEANSYTDQTCYNAAYCYGYVDGATMALNTLSGVPERHKCYAILSHDCKEFDDLPLYIAGEWVKDKFEHYHNFYAVFEQDAAL